MLYRTLKRLLEKGRTDSMAQKLEIFFSASKLTQAEYTELREMLTS